MSETLMRQMAMLRLLPRHPRMKDTATLKSELEYRGYKAEMRNLQRDLQNLSVTFPIYCDTRSKPYGWTWTGKDIFELPGMDPQTALAFEMAGRFMQRILPSSTLKYLNPYITHAHNVLDTLSDKSEIRQWKNKVKVIPGGMELISAEVLPEIVDTVYEALLIDKRLQASYEKRDDELKEYELNPLGLVMMDNTTSLIASVKDYDTPLQFVLHRFKSAELLDIERTTPENFNFDEYVASGSLGCRISDKKIKLKLRFTRYDAKRLIETAISIDQKHYEEDGLIIVEATVPDNEDLRWFLRSYGNKVEVLEPASLCNEFAELAKEMASMYL